MPDLGWAAALSGREVLATLRAPPPSAALDLAHRLTPATDLLAVRASGGNLVGGTLPGFNRSIWCGLPADASITAALATISSLAERPQSPEPSCARGQFEAFGESSHTTEGVQEILERAVCPVGVVVLDRSGTPDLWTLARAPLDPAELAQLAAQRQRVLDADVFSTRPKGASSPSRGLAFQSVLVADSRWWWFGADLVTPESASVWLALPRAAGPGLGWALLATLVRHLSIVEQPVE